MRLSLAGSKSIFQNRELQLCTPHQTVWRFRFLRRDTSRWAPTVQPLDIPSLPRAAGPSLNKTVQVIHDRPSTPGAKQLPACRSLQLASAAAIFRTLLPNHEMPPRKWDPAPWRLHMLFVPLRSCQFRVRPCPYNSGLLMIADLVLGHVGTRRLLG